MKSVLERQIEIYRTDNGNTPFLEWFESLQDDMRYRIKERLGRISLGNLGDYKRLNEGILELRFNFGPGYKIYFGEIEKKIILLLSGGSKSNQKKDIKRAISYWKDYLAR